MSDIVERIRNRIHDSHMEAERLFDEAANEIERLRAFIQGCSTCKEEWEQLEASERLRAELAEVVPASYHLRQITELEAEIERLRAALRPFADYADPYGKFPANAVITMGSQISRNQLTMGDCYEARRALSAPK